MKLFEVAYDGKNYGYIVGQNGILKITKKGNKVTIEAEQEAVGKYTVTVDVSKFPMYTIG